MFNWFIRNSVDIPMNKYRLCECISSKKKECIAGPRIANGNTSYELAFTVALALSHSDDFRKMKHSFLH